MSKGKVLAICQSGGEFVTGSDGSMSYCGGEAHAIDIDCEMSINDLKAELASMFNCNVDTFSIKYFLPRNKRTLITISNDKDLRRMINFHSGSDTTDLYILRKVDNRTIRSVVADSDSPADAATPLFILEGDAKRRKLCTDWDKLITGVGQVFSTPKAFRDALHKYAIANSFMYRYIKNDSARVTAECTVEDCPWRIHASRSSTKQQFMIKKINDAHTCGKELSRESRRLASQRWVASIIKDRLRETPNYKPRDIACDLEREYGLSLNYSQAWRGKFIARKELHNSHEEACVQLPWYCQRIMDTNPGSVATLETSDDSKFHLFVAFQASLYGFEHGCRPLLFLEAIDLKSNKHWKLLVATAVDAENDAFPVAFSVIDAETTEMWHWFLLQLKSLSFSSTLTFVTNGESSFDEQISEVFEDSCIGHCVHHLVENYKTKMPDSWSQDIKDELVDHLQKAIHACKIDEFDESIERIKSTSRELAEWVLASKPERWSNAFFKGLRYGCYSASIAEKVNSWISIRHEPSVVQIIDYIRCNLMEMLYFNRKTSNSWTETLAPSADKKIEEDLVKSRTMDTTCSSSSVFEVRDDDYINIVNIETWECTCRRWQVSGLPCIHALSVIERMDGCIADYCSKYFLTNCYRLTYISTINPIPDVGMPECSDPSHNSFSAFPLACSPRTHRMAGRPKVKPEDPRIAIKRAVRCSKCQAFGHNKQTCKTQVF